MHAVGELTPKERLFPLSEKGFRQSGPVASTPCSREFQLADLEGLFGIDQSVRRGTQLAGVLYWEEVQGVFEQLSSKSLHFTFRARAGMLVPGVVKRPRAGRI
jgi:hypothetical protein